MAPACQRWHACALGVKVLLALLCSPLPAAGNAGALLRWPSCLQRGTVFKHAGQHGLFTNLAASVGARAGCWLGNCGFTDKFLVASSGLCGAACSSVEGCRFWSYEQSTLLCFLRTSDAGREASQLFDSGVQGCQRPPEQSAEPWPAVGDVQPLSPPPVAPHRAPFAAAAIWAAQLPALRPCDAGVGSPGCDNPYAAMGVWRYAVNNLRLAVGALPAEELARHSSTVQYVQQVSSNIDSFYSQPTAEAFKLAVGNAVELFTALQSWLQNAPPVEVQASPSQAPSATSSISGSALQAAVVLADGQRMPVLGFGTWQLLGQQAYDATLFALKTGYRHIDTAQAYMNEREVGLALRDSGVPRSEIFLATKLSDPAEFGALEQRFESQLQALGTNYLDLYMLHSPADRSSMEAAWRSMEALHHQGKVRSLGVSNFGIAELKELLSFARVKPVYVQNKFSVYTPGEQQLGEESLLIFAREKGIQVMGYSVINPWPFLLPPMEDPHVRAVAARLGRTPAQVLHRWALQQGVAVIPKSGTPARIEENSQLDFELSPLDVRLLSGLVALSEPRRPSWADDVYGLGRATV